MVKRRRGRKRLVVTGGGRGLVNHAGARLVADVADDLGLTAGLSVALASTKQRRRGHDRGEVLRDLAVMVADGGTRISDLAVLGNQPKLFEGVTSTSTAWRTLEVIDGKVLERIALARAQARRNAWARGMDPGFYVVGLDATLIAPPRITSPCSMTRCFSCRSIRIWSR
jgi:hypothetical protein